MSEEPPVSQWIEAVKKGRDHDAELGIYAEFFQKLEAMATKRLKNGHDGEAVAQSVLKTFFRRIQDGQFPDLNDRTDLRKLLLNTAVWKINNHRRHQFAKIRDVRRAVSLQWIQQNAPTVELADQFFGECNELLDSLTDEKDHKVARMKLEGYSNQEIADSLGRSVKTVEWRLKKIRMQIEDTMSKDA